MTQINNDLPKRPVFDKEAHDRAVAADVAAEVKQMSPLSVPYRDRAASVEGASKQSQH